MFALIHDMRTRIITSDAFTGDRIIGAILFEDTVFRRSVRGEPTASYLWNEKNIVPFLKIDRGLEPEKRGVRLMKPIPDLAETLARCGHFHPSVSTPLPAALAAFREHFRRDVDSAATDADADAWLERLAERTEPYLRLPDTLSDELDRGVVRSALVEHHRARDEAAIARAKASQGADIVSGVGSGAAATDASGRRRPRLRTKARSVVRAADPVGVREIVAQQFAIAAQVIAAGLVPIIEPEVDIHAPDKAAAETLVVDEISFTSTRSPRVRRVPQAHAPGGSARVRQPHATPTSDACVRAVWGILARGIRAEARGVSRGRRQLLEGARRGTRRPTVERGVRRRVGEKREGDLRGGAHVRGYGGMR